MLFTGMSLINMILSSSRELSKVVYYKCSHLLIGLGSSPLKAEIGVRTSLGVPDTPRPRRAKVVHRANGIERTLKLGMVGAYQAKGLENGFTLEHMGV